MVLVSMASEDTATKLKTVPLPNWVEIGLETLETGGETTPLRRHTHRPRTDSPRRHKDTQGSESMALLDRLFHYRPGGAPTQTVPSS